MSDLPTTAYTAEDLGRALSMNFRSGDEFTTQAVRTSQLIYWRKCNKEQCWKHKGSDGGRHPEKGWITVGPSMQSDPLEYARYMREKHMTPLDQYGSMPTGELSPAIIPMLRHQKLLEQPGGLDEFPLDQIETYGWDKLEIVRSLRPDVKLKVRIHCEHDCPASREFLTPADYKQHVRAVHSEASATDALGRALTKAGIGGQGIDPSQIAAIVAATMVAMEEQRRRPGRPPMHREEALAGATA